MTSGSTLPPRLTKIDDLARPDHYYLTAEDDCYFLGEYTARKGYAFSPTNQLILNFKKPVNVRGTPQWNHKERAIGDIAAEFRTALNGEWLDTATLVPVPPSKAKTDPLYDDRLLRMLRAIRPQPGQTFANSSCSGQIWPRPTSRRTGQNQMTSPRITPLTSNFGTQRRK
jgi:hypothetical protein